jgi:two-component system cell cycle sensor histidine kinase/response regulator CckA
MTRTIVEELEHRLSFERLVLGISTTFINLGTAEIDTGIEHALAQIGGFCDVDRAYVIRFQAELATCTHEWCAAGVPPQIQLLQNLPLAAFPWWAERTLRREVIHVPVVAEMPEEAAAERQILTEQDVVSVVSVPLEFAGNAMGFIGFDSIRHGKHWSEEDMTLLRVAGEIVVNALERKRAEAERSALEEQLIQARSLENVSRLAGGVAHDFNNLLTVIISHALALRRGCSAPALQKSIDVLLQSAEHAADLTRQLMIVGRRDLLRSDVLELRELVSTLEPLLRSSLGESITLTLRPDPQPCWVQLGKAHLKQVIVNLVVNARDALPHGGHVCIEMANVGQGPDRHRAALRPSDSWLCLSVRDDGIGMAEATRRRAFEPFFSTKGSKGTGLGLSTLQSIVQHAGGSVHIESAIGNGTTVEVYLPRVAAPVVPAQATASTAAARGQQELVLLVEDNDALRALVETMLIEHGYRVVAAAHPRAALAAADQLRHSVDLLLTDVILPTMSGRVLAESLTAKRPSLRVAYMSGHDDEVLVRQGVLDDGIWLLPKPFRDDELLAFVRAVLDAPRPV